MFRKSDIFQIQTIMLQHFKSEHDVPLLEIWTMLFHNATITNNDVLQRNHRDVMYQTLAHNGTQITTLQALRKRRTWFEAMKASYMNAL
jgi:hypothetical protein